VDRFPVTGENERVIANGGRPATGVRCCSASPRPPQPPPTPEELEREMEYFVEPDEAFTGRDDIE
jgi:hypothetical protein